MNSLGVLHSRFKVILEPLSPLLRAKDECLNHFQVAADWFQVQVFLLAIVVAVDFAVQAFKLNWYELLQVLDRDIRLR